ncbi:hypothetical protein DENSPDRAFT_882106 [Dentipellis sp. KUC8613]|nr:hypothetical protein DENSPDRAFT_882106 [Dentipellis sp. KUC8613]
MRPPRASARRQHAALVRPRSPCAAPRSPCAAPRSPCAALHRPPRALHRSPLPSAALRRPPRARRRPPRAVCARRRPLRALRTPYAPSAARTRCPCALCCPVRHLRRPSTPHRRLRTPTAVLDRPPPSWIAHRRPGSPTAALAALVRPLPLSTPYPPPPPPACALRAVRRPLLPLCCDASSRPRRVLRALDAPSTPPPPPPRALCAVSRHLSRLCRLHALYGPSTRPDAPSSRPMRRPPPPSPSPPPPCPLSRPSTPDHCRCTPLSSAPANLRVSQPALAWHFTPHDHCLAPRRAVWHPAASPVPVTGSWPHAALACPRAAATYAHAVLLHSNGVVFRPRAPHHARMHRLPPPLAPSRARPHRLPFPYAASRHLPPIYPLSCPRAPRAPHRYAAVTHFNGTIFRAAAMRCHPIVCAPPNAVFAPPRCIRAV